ncbi:MAG: putative lipid II flippase FtsW [Acidimicrobiia bacterium]|nr:putative lipid II flippase FtsW [Acidimicrobiia bacterium]MBV9040007.1 putative lipid II flippase FtsW [Acidimicrobiia bacterium]
MPAVAERVRARGRPASSHARKPGARSQSRSTPLFVLLAMDISALVVVGLVMVLSASSVQALRDFGSSWVVFQRQAMWMFIGGIALLIALRVDYRRWQKPAVPLVFVALGLLLVVLVPGLGVSVRGSSRWIGTGQFRIQPSEFAKLAILLFTADLLARRGSKGDVRRALRPVLLVAGFAAVLVMAQPDMGTTLVLSCIVLSLLFVGGVELRTLGGVLGVAAGGALLLGLVESYRRARLFTFLHPWKDAGNTGYQIVQSLVGLASGHWTGLGLGASRAKWGFLPNAYTDFIFAIIGEELGLIGTLLVIGLFVAFAVFGVRTALKAPDRFGALLAAGITAWVVGQALINIGAVIGVLPVTGVPLPFISFGGSSLVITMGAAGILLNIARQTR